MTAGPERAAKNGRGTRRELVENEMYEHAIRLFAERGFAGTSLQDIADAMGVTRPALYYYVKSKDELPDGEVGELCCRGPYTLRGYLDAPGHNARVFTSDGFYRTGDLAAVHHIEGGRYVAIEGRIKDLINRGGEKISAEEVEQLLLRHPRVRGAAVVAVPDPRLGERACAFLLVEGDPLTLADVREHFAALQVAKFKWPERVEHLAEIPRTLVGKVDKKRLVDGLT